MLETIYLAIIAALPAISSIIGIIAAVVKMTKNSDSTMGQVLESLNTFSVELKNTKEMDEMKAAMLSLAQTNRELQKRYDELLTEITKIKHGEE